MFRLSELLENFVDKHSLNLKDNMEEVTNIFGVNKDDHI